MSAELTEERNSSKPGQTHFPLAQHIENLYSAEHVLAVLVKSSTTNPKHGVEEVLKLIHQSLISIIGRKKNFPEKIQPSSETNTMTPPWYYRLKEKRRRRREQACPGGVVRGVLGERRKELNLV